MVLFLGLHTQELAPGWGLLTDLLLNFSLGALGGYLGFIVLRFTVDKIDLDFQGLYPVLTLGLAIFTFSLVTNLKGNGFLAVYIMSLLVANSKLLHKNLIISFFDGVSWLSQIGLFIMLGLLVSPKHLPVVAGSGLVLALFLTFVARPLSVFLSTFKSHLKFSEQIFVSWAGLRGATPIVFAALVASEMRSEATLIFEMVFFCVVFSALLQGTTLKFVAQKCNLLFEAIYDPDFPVDADVIEKTKHGIKELIIEADNFAVSQRIVDLNLPKGALVLFIKRDRAFVIPDGSTEFHAGDKVLLVTPEKDLLDTAITCFREDRNTQLLDAA